MKLIKSAGGTLRGYIPDLVEKLLALLSLLEPQAVNWLHLNAAKYNLTEEKVRPIIVFLDLSIVFLTMVSLD